MRNNPAFFLVIVFLALILSACSPKEIQPAQPENSDRATAISDIIVEPESISGETISGKTYRLNEGDDLQSYIERAVPGDLIVLPAGSEFRGIIELPKKSGSGYITITSSEADKLPKGRVYPDDAKHMVRIVSPGDRSPAVMTLPGASYYSFVGIEFTGIDGDAAVGELIHIGDGSQSSLDEVPHHILIDRSYIHAVGESPAKRGISLNGAHVNITNSYISGFKQTNQESQAIAGWNGPGPFAIINNYLEGSTQNIMFGGGDPMIKGLVPSDIIITGNTLYKPITWKESDVNYAGKRWMVKTIFELKNSRNVYFAGNVLENIWEADQRGYAMVIKSTNQDGKCTWCVTQDVVVENNIIRHAGGGVDLIGKDFNFESGKMKNITIHNNLFIDIDSERWGGRGEFVRVSDTDMLNISRNTAFQNGRVMTVYGDPMKRFTFERNIMMNGQGIFLDGYDGKSGIEHYFPGGTIRQNLIIGRGEYPTENSFVDSLQEVGFRDVEEEDYSIAENLQYAGIGADVEKIKGVI